VRAAYGAVPGDGSFASNCLIARRLVENDVRFVQLYHWGWDSHGAAPAEALNLGFKDLCRETDQPVAALLTDLRQRGLLEDTLVVWGGEFGRTPMRENRGGVKAGSSYGETDEMGYEVVRNPVEVRDLHATMLYLLGFDHHKLNFPFQGLDQKLTGVNPAKVVADLLA
jgi:arylsulfatase A-like enzyme